MILDKLKASRLFATTFQLLFSYSRITQIDLAETIHVDPSAINHWRNGRRIPTDSATIFLIVKTLGLTPQECQMLLHAWSIDKYYRGLVPFVQEAIKDGSIDKSFVDAIEQTIQDSYQPFKEIKKIVESNIGDRWYERISKNWTTS